MNKTKAEAQKKAIERAEKEKAEKEKATKERSAQIINYYSHKE